MYIVDNIHNFHLRLRGSWNQYISLNFAIFLPPSHRHLHRSIKSTLFISLARRLYTWRVYLDVYTWKHKSNFLSRVGTSWNSHISIKSTLFLSCSRLFHTWQVKVNVPTPKQNCNFHLRVHRSLETVNAYQINTICISLTSVHAYIHQVSTISTQVMSTLHVAS